MFVPSAMMGPRGLGGRRRGRSDRSRRGGRVRLLAEEPGPAAAQGRVRPVELPRSLALAAWLDSRFRIPGTRIRFGWDSIIGLVPVVGDTVATGLGALIVADAVRLGVRRRAIAQMGANLAIDWVLGLVPVVDVVADVAFKANKRNARLLRREWARLCAAGDPT